MFRPLSETLQTTAVPRYNDVFATVDSVDSTSPILRALHQLKTDVLELDIRAVDFYADLRSISPQLSNDIAPRAHVDGGSIATTTDRKEYLFSFRTFNPEEIRTSVVRLKVADDSVHVPTGVGYLKIPCHTSPYYLYVKCYYTPQIPATILSPDSVAKSLGCSGYSTFSDLVQGYATMQLSDCSDCNCSLDFTLQSIRGLLFTESLIAPTESQHTSLALPSEPNVPIASCVTPFDRSRRNAPVHALSGEQQHALWHCRLGHTHGRNVSDLHKYVDGIPKLPRSDPLIACPLCKRAKLHKADRGPTEMAEPDA